MSTREPRYSPLDEHDIRYVTMTRDCDTTERTVTARTTETEHDTAVLDGGVDTAPSSEAVDVAAEVTVRIPDDAAPAEVDAIAAAVRDHLVATGRLSEGDAETRRWVAAHRLGGVEPDAGQLLDGADADPWVAASRAQQRW